MTDLFWDEVLLTNNPDSKELEVSFKKIDGDGFLTSAGDEPGTPGGVEEGPNGEQPPVDDEGDFESDNPPNDGDDNTPDGNSPIPGDNPECEPHDCSFLEGPELVNSRGGPYSANFRVFAEDNSPIWSTAKLLRIGTFEENEYPGGRPVGRIATDFTQGELTNWASAATSDIVYWDYGNVRQVGDPVYAGTELVLPGDSYDDCAPGLRMASISPYTQAQVRLCSYSLNWGNSGLQSIAGGSGPGDMPLGAGFEITFPVNYSMYARSNASKRYVDCNFFSVSVSFGFYAGTYFGIYSWGEIGNVGGSIGGTLDRQTGRFTEYGGTTPVDGAFNPNWEEGVIGFQGEAKLSVKDGYFITQISGSGTAFGSSFPLSYTKVVDKTSQIAAFDQGLISGPWFGGSPVCLEWAGGQGDSDRDIPKVLLYNNAGLVGSSEDLLAEYIKGSNKYTPPDYCSRIP